MPPKRKLILKSTVQSSSSMAHFWPVSSPSSSAPPPPTSSSIDLTSSSPLPSPPTMSASTSQKGGGKTSYIWGHGMKVVHDGEDRWLCNYCPCSYAMSGKSTTNQRDHLNVDHGIPDPKRIQNSPLSTITEDHWFSLMSCANWSLNGLLNIITHSMRLNLKPFIRYSNV